MTVIGADQQEVSTPTVRRVARRSLFWLGLVVVGVLIFLATIATLGSNSGGQPLSATNPAPGGAMALAEVLTQQGVDVAETSSLDDTERAIADAADTTLVLIDFGQYLTEDQVERAVTLAEHVILVDPSFLHLNGAAPEVGQAGDVEGLLDADCGLTAVQKAGAVSGGGAGFRLVDDSADAQLCLASGDDIYSLIQLDRGENRLTVLGTTEALSNEFIANEGNAAFALNLFGEHENLVWYLPSIADLADTAPLSLAELTPPWVNPATQLLVLCALAAAFWRGRRLGPLVVENLPVVVRASETMLGRARLYQKGSARLRALDALRIGTVERLATACGLPRVSSVDEVVLAVAATTGTSAADIRRLLIDGRPASDTELVSMSDELLTLEHAVAAAVRP